MKIALAGNPNCGKTTLFNTLTGSTQYVGNWPGVTVEKKEGKLKGHKDVVVVDLPGIYSLSPYTLEEVVARNYLLDEKPDLIVNVIDATNLERNLYLTTQLMETGIPVVIALNMMDLVKSRKDTVDTNKLSKLLGCPIIEISALKTNGIQNLISEVTKKHVYEEPSVYRGELKTALDKIRSLLNVEANQALWYSVKLFENDEESIKHVSISDEILEQITNIRDEIETLEDDDAESIITNARYEHIGVIKAETYKRGSSTDLTTSDKIDQIVTNRWLALPIFAVIMWLVYFIAMQAIGIKGTDWVNEVLFGNIIPNFALNFLESINCADWLIGLIVDGIIGGVGAVLGFVPQIMVLFFLLSLLEDCGYMARVAFIMDRIFRKFGLSGKSFIPMLIATGCAVPGIMASRTIEEDKDRRMTVMLTSFIPCSAKLPIFGLFAGAIFNDSAWVSTSMYFIGVAAIILSGTILKKTKYFKGDVAPFVMELPAYHMPSIKGLLIHMWDRVKSFVKKAATIILLATILVWFLSNFNWSLQMVEDTSDSILAAIGTFIAPIFTPLGWGSWQATVATFTGFIAKENIVGTFGVLYGMSEVSENGFEIWNQVSAAFTPVSAYSFMVFNLLCAPCFAAIGAIKREMHTAKWTIATILFQCGIAYVISLIIYQVGSLIF